MTTKMRSRTAAAPRPASKAIDPRIRERRVAVLRAQGRRRLRWMVGVVVLAALAAAAWAVTHSSLLDVERVRVTGTQQATPAQVRFAAGVKPGDAILFVDTGAIARNVERVAWIDKARVERSLGGEVDINVTERRPAAFVRRAPDRVALVDARGRVLADAAQPPPNLPEITGLRAVPEFGRDVAPVAAARVLEQLPPALGLRTTRVTVANEDVTLALRDGPEVRLGMPRRVAEKARAAVAVITSTAAAPPRYIDVRVPGAPVAG
ncbi:MAG TPA: FtsQ-type POTRA domain-containing protein [Acidimicrobiia bacterium]|nr:FtsQ-type POTRA domain-containing protein [Acidimicrobiia bacterium]